jgi:uncharacterized protein (TIGR03435 family)
MALAFAAIAVAAYSQPSSPPAFEVASVKLNKAGDRRQGIQFLPGGRINVINIPLQIIISVAYDLPFQSPRISGGPDWVRSEAYDIEATAPAGAIPAGSSAKALNDKMKLMLQELLADRFKLTIRREMKDQPVYALVVPKRAKLQRAKIEEKDCLGGGEPGGDGRTCHSFNGGQGRGLHGEAVNMADLALFVSNWTDRPVIDKTGLKGLFNIQTDGWVPLLPRQGPPNEGPEAQALADPARPTLFAIFDQLGLKLESRRAPVEMFVIVGAERPSEN